MLSQASDDKTAEAQAASDFHMCPGLSYKTVAWSQEKERVRQRYGRRESSLLPRSDVQHS